MSPKSLWNFLSQIRHFTWLDGMEIPKAFLCKTQHLQISATLHLLYNIGINLNSKHCLNSLSHTTPTKRQNCEILRLNNCMFQERIWRSQGSREKSEDGELVSVQPSQSQKFFSEVWFSSSDYSVSTIILASVMLLQNLVQGNYTSLLNNELLTIRKSENLTVKLFSIWIKKFKK